jgi:hypothetical protein
MTIKSRLERLEVKVRPTERSLQELTTDELNARILYLGRRVMADPTASEAERLHASKAVARIQDEMAAISRF